MARTHIVTHLYTNLKGYITQTASEAMHEAFIPQQHDSNACANSATVGWLPCMIYSDGLIAQ